MPNLATDLARAMELLEKATPGPWRWSVNGNIVPEVYSANCEIAAVYSEHDDDREPANAAAIRAAVNFLRFYGPYIAETFKETPNG